MDMEHIRTRIAELDCVVATPKRGAPPAPSLAVVLCHGYGAPGTDLVPLGDELARFVKQGGGDAASRADSLRFYFPAAPDHAQGVPFGRAWWQLDMQRLIA